MKGWTARRLRHMPGRLAAGSEVECDLVSAAARALENRPLRGLERSNYCNGVTSNLRRQSRPAFVEGEALKVRARQPRAPPKVDDTGVHTAVPRKLVVSPQPQLAARLHQWPAFGGFELVLSFRSWRRRTSSLGRV